MKFLSLLAATFLLFACANSKEATTSDQTKQGTEESAKPQRNVKLKARIGKRIEKNDPITITGHRLEGNILYLDVTYSGGCKEHSFELVGSPTIMKSNPPKRPVQLIHDNNDDTCRSMVKSVLEIDISELAYNKTEGSTIILMIEGLRDQITYTYK